MNDIIRYQINSTFSFDFSLSCRLCSAQNIHTESDWDIIFTLLECVGAGAIPADYEESLTLTQVYQGTFQISAFDFLIRKF